MKKTWAQQAVHELEAMGWSLTAIADRTGMHVSSVSDLKQLRSKEPTGIAAVKLYELHSSGEKPQGKAA